MPKIDLDTLLEALHDSDLSDHATSLLDDAKCIETVESVTDFIGNLRAMQATLAEATAAVNTLLHKAGTTTDPS